MMNRTNFWLVTIFTVSALAIFAFAPEPSQLGIVVFPLGIFFPVAVNKRRKTVDLNYKAALLAFVPFAGSKQLRTLYLSA